jgi:hypothetical protein
VGDNNLTDHGNDPIPLGTGFIVRKAANGTGATVAWMNTFPVQAVTAVSRKTHGADIFDINLPLGGTPAIEPRSQGSGYQIVITFPSAVTFSNATISSGTGTVDSVIGSGTTQATVTISAATAQFVTVKLGNVTDGVNTNDVAVTMGILVGDGTLNGTVNSGDAIGTRSRSGQSATASSFQFDYNADGFINSCDVLVARTRAGNTLFPN